MTVGPPPLQKVPKIFESFVEPCPKKQKKPPDMPVGWPRFREVPGNFKKIQWNCSSSVEPVSAFTLELPPWITVVTSSK